MEQRWIGGEILGQPTHRDQGEFHLGVEFGLESALAAYWIRGVATDAVIREMPTLEVPCMLEVGTDLRWVVLHLINETARHAGHADAVRELLDGTTGE